MIKKRLLFTLLSMFNFWVNAQNESSNLLLGFEEKQTLSFHAYDPPLKIKATMSSVAEAENNYPEQLITSIFSATDQAWVNHNTLGEASEKSPEHFEKIKSMDKEKNYFELAHKLTFKVGDIPTAVVKFFFHEENSSPISACYILQKVNGRWYKSSNASLTMLSIMVMRIKTDVLEGVVLNNSQEQHILDLREKVLNAQGGVDVQKLEKEFTTWYESETDTEKLTLYKDPRTW